MPRNVLVFPCGSEIGLEVNRALADSLHFTLFGANSVDDHGKFVYKNYIAGLPCIDDADFIEQLNQVIERHSIDFIIPAHDSAVLTMAENQPAINAIVITSCAETCRICRSKKTTYKVFESILFTPFVYELEDEIHFPVFMKPDVGQGTRGTHKASSEDEVAFYTKKDPSLLIVEYLPGREYTVDCFTDRNRNLLFAAGRERTRIANGISVNSKPVLDGRFGEIAEAINRTLVMQGVWFYQVKERSNGELVLMEIAPRVAGTMALFRAAGVNFAQLSLFDRMGIDVQILFNNLDMEIDRALSSKFACPFDYHYVYIDYDDTLIVKNTVNTTVLKFLYQSRNKGKKIILLSRHRQPIQDSLNQYAISELLFDEIIILGEIDKKSSHVTNTNAVFIDDSFAERKEVSDRLHIPVFAPDAVESLLDWRA